jgi:hypothetical protein
MSDLTNVLSSRQALICPVSFTDAIYLHHVKSSKPASSTLSSGRQKSTSSPCNSLKTLEYALCWTGVLASMYTATMDTSEDCRKRTYRRVMDKLIIDAIRLHFLANPLRDTAQDGIDGANLAVPCHKSRDEGSINPSRLGTAVRVFAYP